MSITFLSIISVEYPICRPRRNVRVAEALETLNVLRGNQQQIILKEEQEVAVEKPLLGQDVLAVLPTGYGKSMMFTVFALAKQLMKRTENDISTSILVISPLTSITADQIAEMHASHWVSML